MFQRPDLNSWRPDPKPKTQLNQVSPVVGLTLDLQQAVERVVPLVKVAPVETLVRCRDVVDGQLCSGAAADQMTVLVERKQTLRRRRGPGSAAQSHVGSFRDWTRGAL